MKNHIIVIICLYIFLISISCNQLKNERDSNTVYNVSEIGEEQPNLLTDIVPLHLDGDVNAIIEIPAGTLEKWEVDKSTGQLQLELVDNKPRIIKYLGYPGNYGMIPGTLLSTEQGGDGDPLDIIVLGAPVKRGNIVKSKIIGVLYLMDSGERDDKLIAVLENSPLYEINNITELKENYNGISEILRLWFTNYKGSGKMISKGFGERNEAIHILKSSISEYQLKNTVANSTNAR